MTTVIWHSTAPIHVSLYVCDLCGAQANTVHFLPWIVRTEQVVCACRAHDPGGYWIFLNDWLTDKLRWIEHISQKRDSDAALIAIDAREQKLSEEQALLPVEEVATLPVEPATVQRRKSRGRDQIPRRTIIAVIARDGLTCHLCGEAVPIDEVHLDHLTPFSVGGSDDPSNLKVAHGRCNSARGTRPLTEVVP